MNTKTPQPTPSTFWSRFSDERGAGLVEFSMVLPILLMLIFGIIESSWAFSQQNDIRHGAREGARIAAVDFGDVQDVAEEVCARMQVVRSNQAVTITLTPLSASGTTDGQAQITVAANVQTLTGFLDFAFGQIALTSNIEFRLEEPISGEAQWWNAGAGGSFTCT
jgi:Flp pilus assembly protein TadG